MGLTYYCRNLETSEEVEVVVVACLTCSFEGLQVDQVVVAEAQESSSCLEEEGV
jgi:hypothetical protein